MAIDAKMVASLRSKTGVGMMECKKALTSANGDFDEAVKLLREQGLNVADKKSERIASEGVVDIMLSSDKKSAAMIEVNSETDFVAKNSKFKEFVKGLLSTILSFRPSSVDELLSENYNGSGESVDSSLKNMIFTIGENIKIRRFVVVDGIMSTYVHGGGTTGVIVRFDADDSASNNPGFAEFSNNIALQVAAMPVKYLDKESVPEKDIDDEKEIVITQIKNDEKNSKKPEAIINKMINGRIEKFYERHCLTEQQYVKEDGLTVQEYVDKCSKEFGGKISIVDYKLYERGEGLEKKEDDFAGEIEKLVKKN